MSGHEGGSGSGSSEPLLPPDAPRPRHHGHHGHHPEQGHVASSGEHGGVGHGGQGGHGGQQPEAPPTCPRHPNDVSYVRCQRCHDPVCPQCQRPAAVGVQCVDCVREGQKSVRSGRTIFGGDVAEIGGKPVVTLTMMTICGVVYLLQLLVPGFTESIMFAADLGRDEPWRFITSAFAHSPAMPGGLAHIGFNMYALWIIGSYLEPMLGRARFAALYLLSAVGGSVVYLLLASPQPSPEGGLGSWTTPAVGASGAVFGLFGAVIVLQRRLGISSAAMVSTVAINAVIGFAVPNIAWQAHLGGFIVGAACAGVLAYVGQSGARSGAGGSGGAVSAPSFGLQWVGLAAIAAVLVAATVIKYAVTTVPAMPVF